MSSNRLGYLGRLLGDCADDAVGEFEGMDG